MAGSKRLKSRVRRKRRTLRGGRINVPARSGWWKKPRTKARREQRDRLIQWLTNLKKRPCADCLRTFPPCAMDFDHLPGRGKRFTISQFVREHGDEPNAQSLLEAEIEKTQVVCACCHRIRTSRRARFSRSRAT